MATSWWKQIETSLTRFSNLQVIHLEMDGDIELLAKRAMSLQANISDGELTLIDEEQSIVIREKIWMGRQA